MIKKYESLFFDLDGTLCDSYNGIKNGIHYSLEKSGLMEIPDNEIKELIGIPLTISLKKYFSGNSDALNQAVNYFREYYSTKGIKESYIYPEVSELLHWAKQHFKLFVITAKPTIYASELLKHHGLYNCFIKILGCELIDTNFNKAEKIKSLGQISNALIIGDKKQDVEAGKELKINTCGVLYGYGTEREIKDAEPDFIVSSIEELKQLLVR
jgi:phosphoglycolate phosphatase